MGECNAWAGRLLTLLPFGSVTLIVRLIETKPTYLPHVHSTVLMILSYSSTFSDAVENGKSSKLLP